MSWKVIERVGVLGFFRRYGDFLNAGEASFVVKFLRRLRRGVRLNCTKWGGRIADRWRANEKWWGPLRGMAPDSKLVFSGFF